MDTLKAVKIESIEFRSKPSIYPEPFKSSMKGRKKRCLSQYFSLENITVNLTTLEPGAISALRHYHSKCDEFIYILRGHPTLINGDSQEKLNPSMCCGFKAGSKNGHHLKNETDEDVVYLEAGDNAEGDSAEYPDDDIKAVFINNSWQFRHKDDSPY